MEKPEYLFKNQEHLFNLNDMKLTAEFSDVTIKVNNKEFRAHKVILAANLKYFKSIFHQIEHDIIIMNNVDEVYLNTFIAFAYTGEMLLTDVNALGLLKIAHYLKEDIVEATCIDYLVQNLNDKEACRAYQLAQTIKSVLLENAAKNTILCHFEKCSQTQEFFDFDYESLAKILCDVNLDSESQQSLFEGIMRWVLHDVKMRQDHVSDLLTLIDITKLDANYLINYFCEILKDDSNICKDIMFFYHKKKQEIKNVMIIAIIGDAKMSAKLQVQFYDKTKQKWCQHSVIKDWFESENYIPWAISNNRFYYVSNKYAEGTSKAYLIIVNMSNQSKKMLSSGDKLLSWTALCACSRFLYLCGGKNKDRSASDQFLRYDSQTCSFESLTPMGTKRSSAAVIFHQDGLLVLGGYNGSTTLNSVQKYDLQSKEWTILAPMLEPRYRHAVAVLDGQLYACGGFQKNSVEVYDSATNSWKLVASMNKQRSNFVVIAHEGKLMAIGGYRENTIEIYDPNENKWQIDHEMSTGLEDYSIIGCGLIAANHLNRYTKKK